MSAQMINQILLKYLILLSQSVVTKLLKIQQRSVIVVWNGQIVMIHAATQPILPQKI